MSYTVLYSEGFLEDVAAHVDYLLSEGAARDVIAAWYDRLFGHIDRLGEMPARCPVDPPQTRVTGYETRKMSFRRYVVFYQVHPDQQCVRIVSFVHGATRRDA